MVDELTLFVSKPPERFEGAANFRERTAPQPSTIHKNERRKHQ